MHQNKSYKCIFADELKGYLAACLIVTIIVAIDFELSHTYAKATSNKLAASGTNQLNRANNDNKRVEVEDKWSSWILILSAATIAVAAIATIYTEYKRRFQEVKAEEQTIHIILSELQENKESLISNFHSRINYTPSNQPDSLKQVNYINAYLELDAYESIINSGLIKYLQIDIQRMLATLYGRIRSRNKLITYMDSFEDLFFLYDESEDRLNKWYKRVEK